MTATVHHLPGAALPATMAHMLGERSLHDIVAWSEGRGGFPAFIAFKADPDWMAPHPPTDEERAASLLQSRFEASERRARERPALIRHHAAKRRTAKLLRTPAWADMAAIRAVYDEAARRSRETGIPHQVDHEVPLQGELVSGLHVHNNLQILTGSENSRKKNRFEVEV